MSLSGLDAALSGLRVAQQQLNTISNNVANVGTEGYSRKILPQSNVVVGGGGVGVRGDAIVRNVDMFLQRDYWTQVSATTFEDTKIDYLNRIQQFNGNPAQGISVAAKLGELRESFASLADSPEDTYLQRSAIASAQTVVEKFNGFSDLLTQMRNETQQDMQLSITKINDKLKTIASLNRDIKLDTAFNKSSASSADLRDQTVKELSALMDISFFTRSDGVMVVQTRQGVELAADNAQQVFLQTASPLGPDSYYPESASGIYVGGDPRQNPTSINVTQTKLGGELGALVELRDDIIPRQQAQLDELAYKTAQRFEAQGLMLFTDATGSIPADTPPVPGNPGPPPVAPVPVQYVGFARAIQVNQNIINDNSLIQKGTAATDVPVQSGSNEVVRRIVQFTFGEIQYQQASGSVDLRATVGGANDMQEWLGLYSQNSLTSSVSLNGYSDLQALIDAGGDIFDPITPGPPYNDEFTITFADSRLVPAVAPASYTLSLSAINAAYPIGGAITSAADQMAAALNNLAPPPDAAFNVSARVNSYGQLVVETRANMTVDASSVPGGMQREGLALLGFSEGTIATKDPYIDIQIGNDNPVRVYIEPQDTEATLAAKLEYNPLTGTGIPGLYVDINATTGRMTLRPGRDDSNGGPTFGGDIKIIGGSFTANGTGGAGVASGATVVEALFGNNNPVANVRYDANTPFRYTNLGPNAALNTGVISSTSLVDYAQKMINQQSEEILLTEARRDDEVAFRDLLQTEHMGRSSVNIDEELSHLILVQTAYAAAARMVSAIDDMFSELINAVR